MGHLMTRVEAAKRLRVSVSTLDRMAHSGRINFIKYGIENKKGVCVRYRESDLDKFIEGKLVKSITDAEIARQVREKHDAAMA